MKTRLVVLSTIILAILIPICIHAADAPGPPAELRLSIEGKVVLLTWKASTDDPGMVTGYKIERATVASGPFKTIGKVKKGVTQYSDKKAKPENIYYYRVRAVAGKTCSAYSNTVTGEITGM